MNKSIFSHASFDIHQSDSVPHTVLFGVPFDSTCSLQAGCRTGPFFIRQSSWNIREYNPRLKNNLDLDVYDMNDIEVVPGNLPLTNLRVESAVEDIIDYYDEPVVGALGGEHSITYGMLQGISHKNITIVQFDAHPDLNDKLYGEKWSHGTVMRRLLEENYPIVQIGTRAYSKEEIDLIEAEENIEMYSTHQVHSNLPQVIKDLESLSGNVYLSVDMDVFDPAYAPMVGNPVPLGLSPYHMECILASFMNPSINIVGFDVVETRSDRFNEITAVNAAKVVYDILSALQFNTGE